MARVFRTVASALISIAALDAVLWKLMVSRIDPGLVQYHLSERPGENRVTAEFSAESLLVWLALIVIWAGVLAHLQGFASRWARAAAATGIFCMQSLVILVFHPLLPLMIVGGNWQSGILRFLCRWDVLADIYEHWGLSRNIHWFIACQIAGTLAVLAVAHLSKAKAWKSQAARKVTVLLLAIAAWLVSCYAEPLLFELYMGSFEAPHLTYLANVPWYPGGHHGSSAGHLGVAIAIAAVVALLVEISKAILNASGALRSYLGTLGFQIVVVWTAFQHGALEWAEHFGSLIFSRGMRTFSWSRAGVDPAWPWPPIAALLILFVLVLSSRRERPDETMNGPAPAPFRRVGTWGGLAWLGAAWILGLSAQLATDLWIPASYRVPHLANVAAVPWDPAGEPQSTTVQVFGALLFAVLGVVLVEIVKVMQIRVGRHAAYWPLLVFQVVLFCDVFASAAPDWAAYALAQIFGPVPVEAFPSWPWISLLALGFLLWPKVLQPRRREPDENQPASRLGEGPGAEVAAFEAVEE